MKIPFRAVAFSLMAALMLFSVGYRIASSEARISRGQRIKVAVEGYDPHDIVRGRYIALSLPGFAMGKPETDSSGKPKPPAWLYASLEEDSSGFTVLGEVFELKPSGPDYLALERDDKGWLLPPFDRFYLNEKDAAEAERLIFSRNEGQKAYVVAYLKDGLISPSELWIGERSFRAGRK